MTTAKSRSVVSPTRAADIVPAPAKSTQAVQVWATIGGLGLAFILFVWGKWVTGPYFTPVPVGPSQPPAWMHTLHVVWQWVFAGIAIGFFYWFLVKPWRRDGRPSTDGLLCAAIFFLFFQDPLSSFTGHWFTYNMDLLQHGCWVNHIPGWMAFGDPGANVGKPLVFTGVVYVWAFFGLILLGSWIAGRHQEWPTLGTPSLIAVCFVALFVADVVLGGIIWLPLGFLSYPRGHWNLFAGSWHQYLPHEGITAGALLTGLASLRHFHNDRGETFADRGVERMKGGTGRKTALKFLTFIGEIARRA
jgi:hypothetical protein